jgi:hypothetical protein
VLRHHWLIKEPRHAGVCGEPGKLISLSLERHVRVAVFNPDVLAFNIAKIAKALLERLQEATE